VVIFQFQCSPISQGIKSIGRVENASDMQKKDSRVLKAFAFLGFFVYLFVFLTGMGHQSFP
jgi:hypothetical protein